MTTIMLVYKKLGQVLNSPQSFGLGDRVPKPLVEALTAMRQCLREELGEEETELSSGDWLSSELSQDADNPETPKAEVAPDRRH
jgi:hypothetical protein